MIKKKLIAYISGATISFLTLLTFMLTGNASALGGTCTWTGGGDGVSFSDASNWSGCSGAPVPSDADNLVFDNTTLSSDAILNNDLTGLTVGTITFSGNGSNAYIIQGNDISIGSGITDSVSGSAASEIDNNLTLRADQSFADTGSGDLDVAGNINLAGYTLTSSITNSAVLFSYFGSFSSSGGLTFDGVSGGADYFLPGSSPNLSGPVDIKNNAVVVANIDGGNALGTGTITVESGGALAIDIPETTGTLTNDLVLAGAGSSPASYGALISCLGDSTGCTTAGNTTLYLTGSVTESADISVVNGAYTGSTAPANSATFDFAGTVTSAGHTIIGLSGSNTIVNSNPITTTAATSTLAPKAPNTGIGFASVRHSGYTLIGGSLIVLGFISLGFIRSKQLAKVHSRRR